MPRRSTILHMKLKAKILMLAVAPLLLAIAVIGGLLVVETQRLERQQAQVLEDVLLSTKREELHSYIALALTSIDHLYGAGRDDQAAKEQAKAILSSMSRSRCSTNPTSRRASTGPACAG